MKKKIVVLGTGFSAFRFLKKIDKSKYNVTVVSPRNHFLFTPLLPSTTVGTIEFRSIIEPVRNIRNIVFHQSYCTGIDVNSGKVFCFDNDTKMEFEISYDYLVIAVGESVNTYGIEGVGENALFLKELSDARKIRNKVVDCFENASLPAISSEEKIKYLRFVICGGGPTGVEFAAELHDFIEDDVKRRYQYLAELVEIILIEATDAILGSFDEKLSKYAERIFKRQNIIIRKNSLVKKVDSENIYLNDETSFSYGLLVWAAGNASIEFVNNSGLLKNSKGKILTDRLFRVRNNTGSYENIFAIGDCASVENYELPSTAQVAQQLGLSLAKFLNNGMKSTKQFKFKNLGMLAYIGSNKALADTPQFKGTGFATFLFWRSAYLTKLVSLKNKVLVLFDWTKTILFGRDISNF